MKTTITYKPNQTALEQILNVTSLATTGVQGPAGPAGIGIPEGGVEYDLLEKSESPNEARWTNTPQVRGIQLDTENPADDEVGRIVWNDGDEVPSFVSNGLKVNLALETIARVRNVTGATIPKGTPVCIVGASGNRISIAPSDRNVAGSACRTLGLTLQNIPNNSFGKVSTFGLVKGLNTSAFNEGDELFVGATAGTLTTQEPEAPARRLVVGYVVTSNPSQGQIFVTLRRGVRVNEIDDVEIDVVTDGDVIRYDGSENRWENVSLGTAADADIEQFATAAQGDLADTALQPLDNVSELTNDANYITAIQSPVQSVNTQTGDVTLTASDVGAYPDTNPSEFVNAAQAASASPVQSVNTQTGDVTLAKADVGLANVPNLDTTDAVAKAHDQNTDTALASGTGNQVTAAETRSHIDATNNPHSVTKAQVGLSNVDNTSDANKPISTATQQALDLKADDDDISIVGKTGSYTDLLNKPDLSALEEVLVFDELASFPATGETGKVYIAEDTGFIYRWSGSEYVQLTDQTAIWGQISGTLSNQTDLQNALNAKADTTQLDAKADKTVTVTAGTGLDGGGTLAASFSIELDAATQASLSSADTALQSGDDISLLTNDADYITAAQAPVQSVNGETGAVDLTASDVGALPDDANIQSLNNVVITNPQVGDVLVFDGTNWVNEQLTDAGQSIYTVAE